MGRPAVGEHFALPTGLLPTPFIKLYLLFPQKNYEFTLAREKKTHKNSKTLQNHRKSGF